MQVVVGPILISNVVGYDVSLSADGGSNRYSFTVPYSDSLLKALNQIAKTTKGIILPQPPQPTPPVQGGSVNGQVSLQGVPGMPPMRTTSMGVPSFPVPADERVRIQCIIRECLRQGVTDRNQIAYVLATAQHECSNLGKVNGKNGYFIPITEFGGPFRYDPYRGRGLVQLTWEFNYRRYQQLTGQPLLQDYTLMIKDYGLSCFVLVHGSRTGTFTGKKLSDYIGPGRVDFIGARRIINGTDRAAKIAGYAREWVRKLPGYMNGVSAPAPSVTTSAAPTSGGAATAPTAGATSSGAAGGASGDITAAVVFQLPGDSDATTGFYAGYSVDVGMGVIKLEAVGYRKASELVGSPLTVEPREGETVSEDNGASLIYVKEEDRRRVVLRDVLSVSQSDSPVTSLTIIKDGKVKGHKATVVVPYASIRVGDYVQSEHLYPSGDYIVDAVQRRDDGLMELTVYKPMEADVKVPPPPQVQGATFTGGGGSAPLNPNAPILQQMVDAALSNTGKKSGNPPSPPATRNGRLSCAWAVNEFVMKPVFGRTFGDNTLSVLSVEKALKEEGWRNVPTTPGAIAVGVRIYPTYGGHIGIIVGPNDDSLSNSSSRAAFVSRYPWAATMRRIYAPARIDYWIPPNA